MIPICKKPYQDELLYGWMVRLMDCNGIPTMRMLQSLHFHMYDGDTVYSTTGKTRLDWLFGLERLCQEYEKIQCFPDIWTIMGRMTGTFAVFPFLAYGYQALRSQVMLRSSKIYRMALDSDVEHLCVCPKCMEEDMNEKGESYYHTWHHLPGVRLCAKHHIPLRKIRHNGKESLWNPETLAKAEEIPLKADIESELVISRFMKEMYENPLAIDLRILQNIMAEEMNRQGYPNEKPYGNLPEDIRRSGFGKLFGDNIAREIRRILLGSWVNKERAALFLIFLFRKYENFYAVAKTRENSLEQEFRELASAGHVKVLSDMGQIVQLQCADCGSRFWIHPYAMALGCGCPECDGKLPDAAFIGRQMRMIGDGQYEFPETFKGYGAKVRILHKTCGRERIMRPADLIWMGRECRCRFENTSEKLQNRIDPSGKNFVLIHYQGKWGKGQIATIRHEACGRTFDVQLSYFEKNPYCRVCRPRNYSTEQFRQDMKALTGDEYEVAGPFVDQATKIRVLHRTCGTYTDARPADFLRGKRCRLCSKPVNEAEIKQMVKEYTGDKYSVVGREKQYFIITDPNGTTYKMDSGKIMQELIRPTPSKIFQDRISQVKAPVRIAARIYIDAREFCKRNGVFSYEDFPDCGRNNFQNAVRWLVKQRYVEKVGYGKFTIVDK